MTTLLKNVQKLAALSLAALFLSMPLANIASASVPPAQTLALSKHSQRADDGSWHKGKYDGHGTGYDDGSWHKGKYEHPKPSKHKPTHVSTNNGRRFECDRCKRSFHDRAELKRHYEQRHRNHDWKDSKHNDRHDDHDKDKNGNAITGFIIGAIAGAVIANNV